MRYIVVLSCMLLLSACSPGNDKTSYEETKKMVVDALQTEEGKKALRDTLGDPTFQKMLVLEQDVVKQSVETSLLSEDGKAFWEHSMQDPKFMEAMAKSMTDQQKELMKQLMTDPAYMKEWEEFWKQPAQQQELGKLLKSSELRDEMKKVVEETIQNPVWKAYWQELVMNAAEAGKGTGEQQGSGSPSGGAQGSGSSGGTGAGGGSGGAGGSSGSGGGQ